jgi:3-oxoacyl-[acyl-carrier protein] reductase
MCGSSAESTAKGVELLKGRGLDGFTAVACDISDAAQVSALFDTIERESGRLDVLVNNAANQGIGHGGPLEMDPEKFFDVFKTNVAGGFRVTQAACNRFFMKQDSRGTVVFLSSNTAQRAIRGRTAYCASKGAINSMVRALALDLGKYGIRVNAVLPGMIKTDRWEKNPDFYRSVPSRFTPIGDVAVGADIADAVYYFAAHARNTTGAELVVDGGNTVQLYPIIPND